MLPRQGESRLWAVRLQAGWTAVFLFVLVECGNRLLEGGRLWASRLSWWGHVVLLLVVFAGVPRTGGTTPPRESPATDPLTDLIIHTAQQLHAFRQDHKQQQPTNLRNIATWNVGGWTQPGKAGDEKLKAIKACLMRGPVALQETHWSEEQATKVTALWPHQQPPKTHTPAEE